MEQSLILFRDVLILTLSMFNPLYNSWYFNASGISWYSLAVATGSISNDMNYIGHINHNTLCSLGSVQGNTALGTVFLDPFPRANIMNTSSRGEH